MVRASGRRVSVYGVVQPARGAGIHNSGDVMERIDDWGERERMSSASGRIGRPPADAPRNGGPTLEGIEPRILSVHKYEDVGYPWVRVTFQETISPGQALDVGDALHQWLSPGQTVYFSNLRPRAVEFILEPAFKPQPVLEVLRYGTPLAEMRKAWGLSRPGAVSRRTPAAASDPPRAAARQRRASKP